MSPDSRRDWLMLLHAQSGIASRGQAVTVGFTGSRIRHRLKSGQWRRVHAGVYATFTGELPRAAALWAAVCLAGEGAMLSHETAAEVHGIVDRPASRHIHVTVASRRRPMQGKPEPGIVIHRSDQSRPQFPFGSWKLPCTRIDDTVLDLVSSAKTFERGYGWIARAVSRNLVTVAALRAALKGRKRARWRVWLTDAFEDSREGVNSPLERRYARDVERAHGLPAARRQAGRTLGGRTHYKDNWYPEYRLAVEIDGPGYHQGDRAEADKQRDNLNLAADGAQTYRFGPVNVTERACESAALVATTLRRNGWTGTPRPCRRPGCAVARLLPPRRPPRSPGQPPRPASQSPRPASQPPRSVSQSPRPASQPPRSVSQSPRPASQPPRPASQPPRPASQPPRPASQSPRPAQQPPRPPRQPQSQSPSPARQPELPPRQAQAPRPARQAPLPPCQGQFPGRPEKFPGRPEKFLGRPEKFLGRPEQFLGRPEQLPGRPAQFPTRQAPLPGQGRQLPPQQPLSPAQPPSNPAQQSQQSPSPTRQPPRPA